MFECVCVWGGVSVYLYQPCGLIPYSGGCGRSSLSAVVGTTYVCPQCKARACHFAASPFAASPFIHALDGWSAPTISSCVCILL